MPRWLAALAALVLLGSGVSASAETAGRTAAQAAVDELVEVHGVTGASVFRTGGQRWSARAGRVSRWEPRPIARWDRFRVASLTKPVVATVVLQLVAEGEIGLDTGFDHYLPELGGDSRITVRHLLQHTSGIPDYLIPLAADPRNWSRTHDVVDHAVAGLSQPPLSEPGAAWNYSNTNYVILGLLVERVTGRSVAQEIADRITRPHGLSMTELPRAGDRWMPSPRVTGYLHQDGRLIDASAQDPTLAWAAGGLVSTGADLGKLLALLAGGRLLPPELWAQMARPFADTGYGLGVMAVPLPCGGTAYGHVGGLPGYSTMAFATPSGGQAVAFSNASGLPASTDEVLRTAATAALCA